jgi:hypothetical protein
MRYFLALCLLAGCAPSTPMRCDHAAFAGFYCEPGAYFGRVQIDAACDGTAVCQTDGSVLCVDSSGGPMPRAPYQLHCVNGAPSR